MVNLENLPRRYVDAEVSRILKRAADLQQAEGAMAPSAGGLTLRELEEIAREVGIDPQYLQRAAAELDTGMAGRSNWTWFTGRPATLTLERTIAGEIPDVAFEALVTQIQRSAGAPGQPSLMGRTLIWHSETANAARSLQVVVTSREGETRIRIEERLHGLAGALFGSLMGGVGGGVGFGVGVGVGIGALSSAVFAIAFPVGTIASMYVAARGIFSRVVGRRQVALNDLIGRMSDVVTSAVPADVVGETEYPSALPRE